MSDNNFKPALEFVLKWEGGYVNDPDDPGGETKWGIAKRYHPNEDIKNLTPERAAEIYRDEYWIPSGAAEFPMPYCIVVFDTAVNMGVGRAKQFDREAKGDPYKYLLIRTQFYVDRVKENPRMQKYLRGWMNRVVDLKKYVAILEADPS